MSSRTEASVWKKAKFIRVAAADDRGDTFAGLANEHRMAIMRWLKDPPAHFPPQRDGDLIKDGVCGVFIAQKLGIGQPTASEHLRILIQAGVIRARRIKQWTFYTRDEKRIAQLKREFRDAW